MEPLIQCRRETRSTAIITLNRPQKRNALSIELMQQFHQQFVKLETDADCRVVIIGGAGPVFCAGLDLIEAADPAIAPQSARWVETTFTSLMNSPLVTVAVVQGAAMAGGAGLLAACDFAVAGEEVTIGFPETRRGLVPALAATLIARRLRDSEMRELFLLAEPIDARRAKALGLVHRVVKSADLLQESLGIAETVCRGGPEAVRQTKQMIRALTGCPSDLQDDALAIHKKMRQSDEAAEGLASFAQHRDPRWNQQDSGAGPDAGA
ncbi:putative enoyl-CoA hydratase echA8 [Stieleria maiorica]|uniref:Putative enoyl-CoA hydratase echA8 n=1 Tax=Stieleria maiorica TaxID=2795974 RepID=A0A5B9MPC4_9BACT|nr:enoyl-CoA hydratase/isomerase family protein [Stieleria maiorica]QEG01585.1 putative enoyl-CoA hydratase echA8 [Stieleria maiorica]